MMTYQRTIRRPTHADFAQTPLPFGIGIRNRVIRLRTALDERPSPRSGPLADCEFDIAMPPETRWIDILCDGVKSVEGV